ncbi:hypothetical protein LG943_00730 [Streptomonospora sp. S1-112]|uniref:Uncharacterized protein n=1 Tax=Streptomonospora mangrovi TaxID=2883123 RepID=A0A9X3NGT9_9ACTN|nr:hypothetical protein [Streptomonospora mangrovi]MDA0562868.1 hypothetical protein [Streptomonospora mangrovi]
MSGGFPPPESGRYRQERRPVVPGRLPEVPRPAGASYPIPMPDLRERDLEFERLLEDIMRAVGRRRFPPIVSDRDRVRLSVFLWRFLYHPGWPDLRSTREREAQEGRRRG